MHTFKDVIFQKYSVMDRDLNGNERANNKWIMYEDHDVRSSAYSTKR
jgi:hypothetical protein